MHPQITSQRFLKSPSIFAIVIPIFLAILLRFNLFYFKSSDFIHFLSPWYRFILENGRFSALQYNFSNYNPPYLYLLVIVSYLFPTVPTVWAVKLASIIFDFLGAFWIYKITKLKYPQGNKPYLAFVMILFTPTVFINSAYWGQCDMIYTSFLLGCLYFICINKEILGLTFFTLAVSFKLQAVFFAPFLFVLILKKRLQWESFLIIPIAYLVTLLPAWFAGRSFTDLLLIYVNQFGTYRSLTMNMPNLYQFISNDYYNLFSKLGVIFTLVLVCVLALSIHREKKLLTQDNLIQIVFISMFLVIFFLPKMHERYFFPIDVFSILYAFYFPKYWFVPVVVVGSSLFSYSDSLLGERMVSLHVLALILLALFIWLIYAFKQSYFDQSTVSIEKSLEPLAIE